MENKQETVQAFIDRVGIKFTCKPIDKRPDGLMNDTSSPMRHFKTTLRLGKRSMVVYFSQGSAYTEDPTCADVLDSLASDCCGLADSFDAFCDEFGYDNDSIAALKIYKGLCKLTAKLSKLFDYNSALVDELYNTERL